MPRGKGAVAIAPTIRPIDPYRTTSHAAPSVEEVALGILNHPEIIDELIRRMVWTHPTLLVRFEASVERALYRRADIEDAIKTNTFGSRFVGEGAR